MIISIIPKRRIAAQELIDGIDAVAGLTGGLDGRIGETEIQEEKRQEREEQGLDKAMLLLQFVADFLTEREDIVVSTVDVCLQFF